MKSGPPLSLDPRACNGCDGCISACPRGAIKVGRTYLKIDWLRCDACGACARVCAPRAIVLRAGQAKRAASASMQRQQPTIRRSTDTPRARSAAKLAEMKASGKAAVERAAAAPVRGGKRGGFQWTLLEAIAMLSVTFSAFTLKETLALTSVLPPLPAEFDVPLRVAMLALYYVIQVAVLLWLVRRRGGEPLAALGLRPSRRGLAEWLRSAGLVLAAFIATRSVAWLYAYLTRSAGLMPSATTDLPTLFGANTMGFVLAMAMVVVVGPVVEEAVFRGALLEGLTARWGASAAIAVQALLFAAFHRSLWQLFPTFVLGLALGWLAHRRESLWPAIALHGLYNGITVALAFLVTTGS